MISPTSLFKYRKFDKTTIELFVNRQLWFAKPSSLNDPFEAEGAFLDVLDAVWEHYPLTLYKRKRYIEIIEGKLAGSGICSFSKAKKNQLMWSHYADEHKGICIGFNEQLLRSNESDIYPIDVTYQADYPFKKIIEKFKFFEKKQDGNTDESIATDIFYSLLGTKYSYWRYERERRLVFQKSKAIEFPEKAVSSITFGLRMADRDKNTLKKLLSSEAWGHVKWYQAEKSNTKYGLEFNKI